MLDQLQKLCEEESEVRKSKKQVLLKARANRASKKILGNVI